MSAEIGPKTYSVDENGMVQLYIKYSGNKDLLQNDIISSGGRIDEVCDAMSVIQAWVPYTQIDAIADRSYVTKITFPDYCQAQAGRVMTEGDSVLKADRVRSMGCAGAGIKVGIISNGIDGIKASVASGDIPANYEAKSARSDNDLYDGSEGLAMMEIVHDIAPDSKLAFSNPETSVEMLKAIQILDQDLNCDIIVDDVMFFNEPYFEDGAIAKAMDDINDKGKLYICSAGNYASMNYWENDFSPVTVNINGQQMTVNDFSGSGDWGMNISVPGYTKARFYLQWDEPFGGASSDYDLLVTDMTGSRLITSSCDVQNGSQDPAESVAVKNSGSNSLQCRLVVRKKSGQSRHLKIAVNQGYLRQYSLSDGSVIGSHSASGALTVGAVRASSPDYIEYFSSRGPVRMGTSAVEYRQKPEICGVDGVSVTGNGGFDTPFYGTSAAAPHIAALAALVWSSNRALTNDSVKTLLETDCYDLGAKGFDNIYGWGRPDVYESILTAGKTPPPPPVVLPVPTPMNTATVVLKGTKSADTVSILMNGAVSNASYPSATSWECTLGLSEGENDFYFSAKNLSGIESSKEKVVITPQNLIFSDNLTGSSVKFPLGYLQDMPSIRAERYVWPERLGPAPAGCSLAGDAIDFTSTMETFQKPVYITLKVPQNTLNPRPFYWDEKACKWTSDGLVLVSCAGDSVTFTSTHFSVYGIFASSGNISGIPVYPNPLDLRQDTGVNFGGLSGTETIRIYDINGALVYLFQANGAASWKWTAVNNSGRQVASGIYFYVITDAGGMKRLGKIAVIE